jgi:hypothetical protein
MTFGSQADGDPVVRLVTNAATDPNVGVVLPLEGLGSGYHDYELASDPGASIASFYADGVLRYSGYAGHSSSPSIVAWGGGQSSTTGQGNFAAVEFSVPEPRTGMVLLLLISVFNRRSRGRASFAEAG